MVKQHLPKSYNLKMDLPILFHCSCTAVDIMNEILTNKNTENIILQVFDIIQWPDVH